MPTLSLAMIVRNEADRIANVLEEASICCDELVVLDTGSTDATVEIAEEYGAEVATTAWRDDFAWARNLSFEFCTSDWILWLDADDHLPTEAAMAINSMLSRSAVMSANIIDAVSCEYRMIGALGEVTLCFDRERLIRREAGLRWEGRVHETIAVAYGRSVRNKTVWVEHRPNGKPSDPRRNLRIMSSMLDDGDESPRTLFYIANEYRDLGDLDMARTMYRERLGCTDGWKPETAQAAYELGKLLMGVDNNEAQHWLEEAVELTNWERAEPMRQLQHLHLASGRSATARHYAKMADALRPPPGGLFIESWAYSQ